MSKLSDYEKESFHKYLDMAIEKAEDKKNIDKKHFSEIFIKELFMLLEVEVKELNHAIEFGTVKDIASESLDILNFTMFIMSNLNQ